MRSRKPSDLFLPIPKLTTKSRRCRRFWPTFIASVWLVTSFLGCGSPQPTSDSPQKVVLQLNWYPEPEHGGAFAAVAAGYYQQAGIEVEIRQGGPATPLAADLESGRCQFAFANADDVAMYRNRGVKAVALHAALQDHPRCILVRKESGVESLEQLGGLTLQRQPGMPFVEFMRIRGLLEKVKEVPYTGTVAGLVTDPSVAIQAYCYAEPLQATQQGVEVNALMVSTLGWNPYSSVLITTERLIREQPELVRQVVQATNEGWLEYITRPEPANELILAANRHGMTREVLEFGVQQLPGLMMPAGMTEDQIGQMSLERWQELIDHLVELDLIDPKKVRAEDCFDVRFLMNQPFIANEAAAKDEATRD